MGVGRGLRVAELDSVKSKTERGLDTRSESLGVAEAEDTGVVDLGLDESGVVEVGLGTDLEVDIRVGALGVVGGTGTSLGVSVDAVVVAGRVGGEVAETVEGDGVVGGVEASAEVVSAQLALLDIVASLGTGKEAVAAENGVSGEGGALEEVKVLTGVETGLLVGGSEESVLGLLLGDKGRDELELEALGDVVLELNVVAENVGSGPGLGEGDAVLAVLPLGLEVAVDGLRLGVTDAENAEGDTVGGLGLDLERVTVDGVVLGEEVVGSLACLSSQFKRQQQHQDSEWRTANEDTRDGKDRGMSVTKAIESIGLVRENDLPRSFQEGGTGWEMTGAIVLMVDESKPKSRWPGKEEVSLSV